jgi:ABC-type oligopeptide transport system substrate-binding subunit
MKLLALAVASSFLVACSSSPTTKSDDPAEEKVYRTGSHVPVKDKSAGSSSVTTNAAPQAGMPAPYIPGKGGGQ